MNWKQQLLEFLKEHCWQLTPEQQFKFAIGYMFRVAQKQLNRV